MAKNEIEQMVQQTKEEIEILEKKAAAYDALMQKASTRIKIEAKTQQDLDERIESVLNLANVFCTCGHLPTDFQRKPELGYTHIRTSNEKYDLYPRSNDYWAFIREAGEFYVVLEFMYRRDKIGDPVMTALVGAICAAFRNTTANISVSQA